MALAKGTNSYVTVAEADAYFADSLNKTAWTSANSTQKAQALVTATSMIDEKQYTGMVVSDSQELAFPRYGSYFDPKYGTEVVFDDILVPERIVTATYELAYHLLNNPDVLNSSTTVRDLSVGSISLSHISSSERVPTTVSRLLRPLTLNAGLGSGNTWWRAN